MQYRTPLRRQTSRRLYSDLLEKSKLLPDHMEMPWVAKQTCSCTRCYCIIFYVFYSWRNWWTDSQRNTQLGRKRWRNEFMQIWSFNVARRRWSERRKINTNMYLQCTTNATLYRKAGIIKKIKLCEHFTLYLLQKEKPIKWSTVQSFQVPLFISSEISVSKNKVKLHSFAFAYHFCKLINKYCRTHD